MDIKIFDKIEVNNLSGKDMEVPYFYLYVDGKLVGKSTNKEHIYKFAKEIEEAHAQSKNTDSLIDIAGRELSKVNDADDIRMAIINRIRKKK